MVNADGTTVNVIGSAGDRPSLAALTMVGAAKTGSILPVTMAFALSSLGASLFAALAVVAGLLVLFAPRAAAGVLRRGEGRPFLVGVLVLSLPLVARLPAAAQTFASDVWWLQLAPPAWFVGLERWLLGDGRHAALAAEAALATVLVLIVSVASYILLYHRFDQVMLQPAPSQGEGGWSRSLDQWVGRAPVRHAIRRFVSITIWRSVLHQGLVVGLLPGAGGFVLNSLLSVTGWNKPLDTRGRSSIFTLLYGHPESEHDADVCRGDLGTSGDVLGHPEDPVRSQVERHGQRETDGRDREDHHRHRRPK
jgi:hypothetical protein